MSISNTSDRDMLVNVNMPAQWLRRYAVILSTALGPVVHTASNRNEYQKQKSAVSGE
jgi:hypothetical protein